MAVVPLWPTTILFAQRVLAEGVETKMGREENTRDWYPEDDEETSQDVDGQKAKMRQWYGVEGGAEFD